MAHMRENENHKTQQGNSGDHGNFPLSGLSWKKRVNSHVRRRLESLDPDSAGGDQASATAATLVYLARQGDVSKLTFFLQQTKDYDINSVDFKGQNVLQIAVRSQNEALVDFLLTQDDLRIGDEILYAVKEQNMDILIKLLDRQSKFQQLGCVYDSAEFPNYMTPLMLACHMNNHDIILMLYKRGHALDQYEEPMRVESLEKNRERIAMVRARSSPAYLCITSEDPILQAFHLSHQAHYLSKLDPVYTEDYDEISRRCEQFAVDLLEECRTSEEVAVLLSQKHDSKLHGISNNTTSYPRLTLAITFKQKQFVTHNNCQQVLQDLWTQNHREIMWKGWVTIVTHLLPRMLLMPLVAVIYVCYPHASFLRQWKAPIIKFTSHMITYIIFLFLLILEVATEDKGNKAARMNSAVDYIVWVYVLSFIITTLRSLYLITCEISNTSAAVHGAMDSVCRFCRCVLRDWWLMYDVTMELLFIVSFIAANCSVYRIYADPAYNNVCRICWSWDDPTLVSEGFFAMGVVFAFGKVLYFFKAFSLLGPIQVSLAKMIYNVREMFLILVITVVAFSSGLYSLYHYYRGMTQRSSDGLVIKEQNPSFSTWVDSFETLFWSMIGYGDRTITSLVLGTSCPNIQHDQCPPDTRHDNHRFTHYIGKILFGFYNIVMVVVLLNTLVALFSNTLKTVKGNKDVEWKFARSELWLRYFEHGRFLPAPLNLLPSMWNVLKLSRWLRVRCCPLEDGNIASCSKEMCCVITTEQQIKEEEKLKKRYEELMSRLLPRYLHTQQQRKEHRPVTHNTLMQAKQELKSANNGQAYRTA